ncbi:MAG: type II toxin-antitoxin system VapC family toxin [Holophagales bacterium]|nr:type II toxin-antitoxin system VapC family toxin [Holophagales bacterium]
MGFLIDTNIISEVRKGDRCDPHVARWWSDLRDEDLYLSVLVLGEIRKGIERIRPKDPAKATALEDWLGRVRAAFADRILPIDEPVAQAWGRMSAMRSLPLVDGLLAATAETRGLTLATRNLGDVGDTGAMLFDPFAG